MPHTLNQEQESIINHIQGALLVLAPVGSGKTWVLSERVLRAVNSGIPPQQILCLTFTNRAAQEMSDRLRAYLPEQANQLTIKTFHGLCAWMLRLEGQQAGLAADFSIYDENDCKELLKEISGRTKPQDLQKLFAALIACKTEATPAQLAPDYPAEQLFAALGEDQPLALAYQQALRERQAIDFADLVFYTRSLLYHYPQVQQRWSQRFSFIQVDEVQDTHRAEYEIVYALAKGSGNVTLIGDLDQTIYEWRGSEPETVLEQFRQDFQPQTYSLIWNYRSTQLLLKAASDFARSFAQRHTRITPVLTRSIGQQIQVRQAATEREEARWIGEQIQTLAAGQPDFAYNRLAILTRTQKRIETIAPVLQEMGIPAITPEQLQFFMHPEIKDALAYLRLILNPYDGNALRRVLRQSKSNIDEATIQTVIREGQTCGLRLTDLLSLPTLAEGDPFIGLERAYQQGRLVVFDVETTGFSGAADEVIELAAIALEHGQIREEFNRYIRNTVPVGETQQVHGYSDDFLATHGQPAATVFREFCEFSQGAVLVGHNLGFDIKMVTAHARRVGIEFPSPRWEDTLNLAHRFIQSENYKLATLASSLNLSATPTHRASDDTRTTVALLEAILPLLDSGRTARQALVAAYADQFRPLAAQFAQWRDLSHQLRPAALMEKVLWESGLYDDYTREEKGDDRPALVHLYQLVDLFQYKDNLQLHPHTALRPILEFTTLAKSLDQLSREENLLPLMTIHQSKGLEFDTVFLAGCSEGELPSFFSLKEGRLEEEKRLFYVALTRAQKRLFISGYKTDSRGAKKTLSRFVYDLPPTYIHPIEPEQGEE
uniref:DNA 3'-5' helicase n=1 Tax=Cyanothece sp. (strain PCC 7425 / ATCC 29141) TaxID=395961 RepID=B8HW82_CYAP4